MILIKKNLKDTRKVTTVIESIGVESIKANANA